MSQRPACRTLMTGVAASSIGLPSFISAAM
jgi:hypothetical protein